MIWLVLYILGIPFFTIWLAISILYARAKNLEIKGKNVNDYKFLNTKKTKLILFFFILTWPFYTAYMLIKIPINVLYSLLTTNDKKER